MKFKMTHPTNPDILGNAARSPDSEPHLTAFRSWRRRLGYFSILTALPAVFGWCLNEAKASEPISPTVPAPIARETERRQDRTVKNYSKPELLQSQTGFLLPHQKEKFDLIAAFTGGGDDCPGLSVPIGSYTAAAPFIDTRDTNGLNNTYNTFNLYCYFYCPPPMDVKGPDVAYTFSITSRGAAPEIRVTPTSASYDPTVYIVSGCPGGTGHDALVYEFPMHSDDAGRGGAEVINAAQINSLPLNTRLFLFVDSPTAINSGPYTLRMQDVSVTSGPASFDFDRDARSDISVFRPSEGVWYRDRGDGTLTAAPFGTATDRIVPADYDGDGKTDYAIYRDGDWWWIDSSTNSVRSIPFGLADDVTVPADYTGDGRAELAVYRDGVWWTYDLADSKVATRQFGLATDKPVPGDYDGDGIGDFAVFRDGVWYLDRSTQGFTALQWGLPTDKVIPADYDGDGKLDPAVYREGAWWIMGSTSGIRAFRYGTATDMPVPADYDGDGVTDIAYYRNGVWHLLSKEHAQWGTESTRQFGLPTDKPIPSAYIR